MHELCGGFINQDVAAVSVAEAYDVADDGVHGARSCVRHASLEPLYGLRILFEEKVVHHGFETFAHFFVALVNFAWFSVHHQLSNILRLHVAWTIPFVRASSTADEIRRKKRGVVNPLE